MTWNRLGIRFHSFDHTNYADFNSTTDASGTVEFTLPQGDYRFRADRDGTQFWSGETNHCSIPGCETASVTVTNPVTVTVQDTDGIAVEGLLVYVFDGDSYIGFSGTTDASGAVAFTLSQGDYRFRADRDGTQFWSASTDECAIPGCEADSITVTRPVTVTVASELGDPYPDLPVYVFDGDTYTGFNGTSDENGLVEFTLPQGDYRFRADLDGVQFWSGNVDHCAIPGCEAATVAIPGGLGSTTTTIDYTYDPLHRLTAADYSSGEFFHYTYDAVGNRLTEETHEETNTYSYDIANRLASVNGVSYSWDDNGNLLDDGASTYSYDHANRLAGVTQGSDTYNFAYNGMGDRLRQTVNGAPTQYTLDINRSLTQVLADGDNTYLYGLNRIGEEQLIEWQYHLPDALGSVRQLTDPLGTPTRIESYEPFGSTVTSIGTASTSYRFTGEWMDSTELIHLRARYYDPTDGRFINRDTWPGLVTRPLSLNRWLYAEANPTNLRDPSGHFPEYCRALPTAESYAICVLLRYELLPSEGFADDVTGQRGCWQGPVRYLGSGYEEGAFLAGAGGPGLTLAREVVYDFAAMQRAEFDITAITLGDSPGVEGGVYSGFSYGFKSNTNVDDDYSGNFVYGSAGVQATIPIAGIPVGAGFTEVPFATTDLEIIGVNYIVELAASPPGLTFELGYGDAVPVGGFGNIVNYSDDGRVDVLHLVTDIATGSSSPWPASPPELTIPSRAFAVQQALTFAWIYQEVHALD